MPEKTEAKTDVKQPSMMDEVARAGSRLAIAHPPAGVAGYAPWQPPPMTAERKEFLKRQFTPTGCSDLEFEFFLAYCERTGLDPVIKQAYLVERKQKVFKNGVDVWVSKFEPMSAEQGMAARADALPDYRGIDDGVVYEGDVFNIDYSAGVVLHTAKPLERKRIIGAWAHVHREGRRVPITWLKVEERIQTKSNGDANMFWSKMTATQILKCARAEQWRQAYPNIFGGQYVPEEMDREEIDVTPPNAEEAARPTADKLADKIKPSATPKTEAKAPASSPPKQPKPSGVTIDVQKVEPPKTLIGYAELKADLARFEILYDLAKLEADTAYAGELQGAVNARKAAKAEPKSNVVQLPSQQAAAKQAANPEADPSKVTVFGDDLAPLGSEIGKLEGPTLLQMIALGEAKIGPIKNATRKANVRACIDAMIQERKRREDALIAESEASSAAAQAKPDAPPRDRQPGDDDGEF